MIEAINNSRSIKQQVVLSLQGGGALGAFQVGVFQALHEANIEPDWVIGTSIGAFNAAIIAGNPRENRLERLLRFWKMVEVKPSVIPFANLDVFNGGFEKFQVISSGVNGFFKPRGNIFNSFSGEPVGVDEISFYDTTPLKATFSELIDFEYLNSKKVRLMLGATNADTGEMVYFDSFKTTITDDHIRASGALPPGFPAIMIDGQPYWDGGVSSNSPEEVFMNTLPRVDSVVFSVNLWSPSKVQPKSMMEIQSRLKDIQYSSRTAHHIRKEREIHRLRRAIDTLMSKMTREQLNDPVVARLEHLGCPQKMHFIQFTAPFLPGDDFTKDISFDSKSVGTRIAQGKEDGATAVLKKPWEKPITADHGIMVTHIGKEFIEEETAG